MLSGESCILNLYEIGSQSYHEAEGVLTQTSQLQLCKQRLFSIYELIISDTF